MKPIFNLTGWLSRVGVTITLTASVLAGCGGGGSGLSQLTGVSSGGTGSGGGTVTGFGSVFVDGIKYDDSAAQVEVEQDSNKSVALTEVKLGQKVEFEYSSNGAVVTHIVIASEVIGRVNAIDLATNQLVVAGQTVQVNPAGSTTPTTLEGLSSLADLAVGNIVEVHGDRDAAGVIQATRLERKPFNTGVVRVVGFVAALDAANKTFTVGSLVVDYSAVKNLLNLPNGLTNGLRVAVWSTQAISNNVIKAEVIRGRLKQSSDGTELKIGGLIGNFVSASSFTVAGQPVDASAATFDNGSATDLINGRRVRVKGTITNGVLKATEVRFFKNEDDLALGLTGAITDFVSNASFKVRGVTVDASTAVISPSNSTLANGAIVEVKGKIAGNVLTATKVEVKKTTTSTSSGSIEVKGVVYDFDTTTTSFRVNGVQVNYGSLNIGNTTNGSQVEIKGVLVGPVLIASSIEVTGADDVTVAEVRGFITDYVSATDFRVAGQKITTTTSTVYKDGTATSIANGAFVKVKGSVSAGVVSATEVDFQN